MHLLFDIGGTNTRIAVSDGGTELGESKTVSTSQDFAEGMRMLQTIAEELAAGEKISAIAGGVAGTFDKKYTVLTHAPHLSGWVDKPLKKELENLFSVPVYLENDAALAGLGEATMGAGRGYNIIAYVTVSTGVGGVRVVDGMIDRHAIGFEIGHQIINYDGEQKTLEEYVSGSGLLKRFGVPSSELMDSNVWEETAEILSVGVHNTILHWSPDVLVLGGPVVLQSHFPFEKFTEFLDQAVREVLSTAPEVKKAELGDKSALYGAQVYVNSKIM